MTYDAVLAYADKTCSLYNSFRLPAQLVLNPGNEIAAPRSSESENCKECIHMKPENWIVLKDDEAGRTIEPIPFTGESEEFSVKVIDEELTGVKNDNSLK